jgi:hypothetical protein
MNNNHERPSRRHWFGWLAGGGAAAIALSSIETTGRADEEIALDKLPKAVRAAADRIMPKAEWLSATKITDDGKIAYDLDGRDGKKRDVTIMVTAEGKVVEWETLLHMPANVPAEVLEAIRKNYPKFEPKETHLLRSGKDLQGHDDGDHLYDMRGVIVNDRSAEFQVTPKGKIEESTVEIPIKEVPKEVKDALTREKPKFDIGPAYVIREDRKIVGYQFEATGPKGRDRMIAVSADGKEVDVIE